MKKKDFTFKNRNGKRISATLREPAGEARGTIILLHGLGGWKEQPLLVIMADAFCHAGFQVVTFDAADGAKGPDADFRMSTVTGYQEDLEDVVSYIKNEDWFAGPLILVGHSLGGTIAIRYARMHSSMVTKLVACAPAVSWKSANALTIALGLWWIALNKNKTPGPDHKWLPLDKTWLFDFMKFNSKRDAPYISAPTLIVSASKDDSLLSAKAHFSLGKWFPNATNVVIPGANHVFWKYERKLADTILEWLT